MAEVLITLGIIGVVAAMTMPTLMAQHRKKVVETRLAKFYSTMNQAVKLSEVYNGDKAEWDSAENGIELWFNKYFKPYLQLTDVKSTSSTTLRAYFTDGSVVQISSSSWIYFVDTKYEKSNWKDFSGTQVFTFAFFNNRGIEPFQYYASTNHLLNFTEQGCMQNKSANSERACCAALIQRNGWKIPKDYPLKF